MLEITEETAQFCAAALSGMNVRRTLPDGSPNPYVVEQTLALTTAERELFNALHPVSVPQPDPLG